MQHLTLRVFGFLGMILFIPIFLLSFADPQLIENSGKSFIEWKLEKSTNAKIDSIKLPNESKFEKLLGNKAKELRNKTEEKIQNLKQQLKDDAPSLIAAQLSKIRNLDCECRKSWEKKLRNSMKFELASLNVAKSKLVDFTQAKYMEIVEKLTLDVRIFVGANGAVFLFLMLASFLKPAAIKHLFLPSVLMLVSTVLCSYFYIFEQNWFYTIIYNNYTGFTYVGYLTFVFAVLCDIVFNKAKVTTEIINAFLQTIGHAASLVPC
ncbi:hypothetical protein [Moritella sp.]|uniref:hypothetical protein n=1 Tax=Moritella sp. TaxID=78556 RepID=UPI001DC8ED24|nr:hypothetical protein [Moritella sp.]MCJ8348607.1 hypothetical protein [Moritella sp.]NQZ41213.1 hypothetical protein [Moritella sp.]